MTHHISRYYPPPPNHSDHDDISDTLAIFLRGLVDGEGDRPRLVRRTVIRSDTVVRSRLIGFEQKVEMRNWVVGGCDTRETIGILAEAKLVFQIVSNVIIIQFHRHANPTIIIIVTISTGRAHGFSKASMIYFDSDIPAPSRNQ